jgi:hypothetical protein
MPDERHTYDPKTADPRVQAIITVLISSHQRHGATADVEQEALARRQLRFVNIGGKFLTATYIDSALAFARKAADLKEPGKPS